MTWPYQYTPYILPMLASAMFMTAVGVYAWRQRSLPGALLFALVLLFRSLWAGGAALELAAMDVPAKIFWVKFQGVWQLPAITAELCFALDYANLRRWLTRRTLTLLAIPPLLVLLLVLTNDAHHWIWQGFSFEGYVRPVRGSANWILTGYGYLLALMDLGVFAWLFIRSSLHRWPVALCVGGQFVLHMAYVLDAANVNPVAPMDPAVLAEMFTAAMYALALFRFRMFDPIPVARETVIEQMREGMLVLDTSGKIVDLNSAAEKILGVPAARARGREARQVLPAHTDFCAWLDDPSVVESEISLGTGRAARSYALHLSPLRHRRGFPLGRLILLHDMTEQKRAQAQLVEQQRALAMMEERERLARELHDGLSQVIAFMNVQAQTAHELIANGQSEQADASLMRLAAIAREAHGDVRESISSLMTVISPDQGFLPMLQHYLVQFGQNSRVHTELQNPEAWARSAVGPVAEVQLLRIIQEALANTRKHACARNVRVRFVTEANQSQVVIEDDGIGFDPAGLAGDGQKYGLHIMRTRAAEIGASLQVSSTPGQGTQVIVQIPVGKGKATGDE